MRNAAPILFIVFVLALVTGACLESGGVAGIPPATPAPASTSRPATQSPAGDWYSLYFTDPNASYARSLRGGIDDALAEAIDGARLSIEVAVLQLDLWSIRDALLHAYERGVEVRVVVESDYLDEDEIQDLIAAGIPVLGDRREGLMHNKFFIIDRQEVWTGSLNPTISETYRNNNNLVRLRATRLAEDYLAEFEEMFTDDQFGPGSPANTPHPRLTIAGTPVQVYFSPDDGAAAKLVDLIGQAQESVYFLAFSFTSDDLAEALLERAGQGVEVAGVMESSQVASNSGTEYERLRAAGLDVRLDGNRNNMHHKVLIIDGETVVFGSYNFSFNAEKKNDENSVVITNADFAAGFMAEFDKVFAAAED